MPIQASCPGCGGKFRVPDAAAGKKVRCPKCKEPMPVPALEEAAAPAAPAKAEAKKTPRPEMWRMKAEGGEEYGPISRSELDAWHAEGRVTAECQLLRDGSEQWQWASDLYPELEQEASAAAAAESADEVADDAPVASFSFTPDPPAAEPASTQAKSAVSSEKRSKKPVATPSPEDADEEEEHDEDEEGLSVRSKAVAGLLGIFLGPLGIHRFYLGYVGIGLAMLFTGGGCGIWSLLDAVFILLGKTADAEGRKLRD